jgi:uncharacterized protein YndB with AHSA1/START domain
MSEPSVLHDTVVVRRRYEARAERVFRAWAEPELLARWYVPGDESWSARIVAHDFRVGKGNRVTFGPPAETYTEDCHYVDIVPNRRIIYAMTVARGETRLTVSLVTVDFTPRGAECDVCVTDQLAILDGFDTAAGRERGWSETLDKLPPVLAVA